MPDVHANLRRAVWDDVDPVALPERDSSVAPVLQEHRFGRDASASQRLELVQNRCFDAAESTDAVDEQHPLVRLVGFGEQRFGFGVQLARS